MKSNPNQTSTKNSKIKLVFVITGLGTGDAKMMLYKFLMRINRDKFAPIVISMIDGAVFKEC